MKFFDAYFEPVKNVIFERSVFNKMVQEPGQSLHQFIVKLQVQSDNCEYGTMRDDLVRDRIVVGVRDSELRKYLIDVPDLTLRLCIQKAKQYVSNQEHVAAMAHTYEARSSSSEEHASNIDALQHSKAKFPSAKKDPEKGNEGKGRDKPCGNCGKWKHFGGRCPAESSNCNKCKRKGHWAKMCQSARQQMHELDATEMEEGVDSLFLGGHQGLGRIDTIDSVTETENAWYVELEVNSTKVKFKIDSGAAVTAIPMKVSDALKLKLRPTTRKLMGAGNTQLTVVGVTTVNLSYGEMRHKDKVFVIEGLARPLLGKPAIKQLGVFQVTNVAEVSSVGWKDKFPSLFCGLGTMKSQVRIELKDDTIPFAQATPRRVAAARRRPLQEELHRMERMGVIQKIEEPTDWCAPCIVVPKKDGKIRVCIDFTQLNKAVRRAYHPLPATDETIADLGRSRVFSKLDANCGYWQLRLDESSQKLTTFITPFGRYFCKRLPFGISSAPEIFQREMQKALEGIEGVLCQMDDILIHTETEDHHASKVEEVLTRLALAGITLNEDKCEFFRTRVTFLGHVIDETGIHADPGKVSAIQEFPAPKNRKELKRFLGMVNYLGKFISTLADDTVRMRTLLKLKDNDWLWTSEMTEEFARLKQKISSFPVLVPFDLELETWLSADASSYGLGAAIFQKNR
jgi:predicted aspartyl protease